MDTLRELMSLGRENWPIIKDVLAIVGGVAVVLNYLSILTGIRKRRAERKDVRWKEKVHAQATRQLEERARAEWFSYLFRHKQDVWNAWSVDKMTVQQACGFLGDDLPDWACNGWERVLISDLNKPVKKG